LANFSILATIREKEIDERQTFMCLKFLAFLGLLSVGVLVFLGLGLVMLEPAAPYFPEEPSVITSDPAINAQLFIEAAVAGNIEEALLYVCDAEVATWRENLSRPSTKMTINDIHCTAEGETTTCTLEAIRKVPVLRLQTKFGMV
jgi:hypothetical protein